VKSLLIAVDFDGTIVPQDVGNALFHDFTDGRGDEAVERWRRGEIGSVECYIEEARHARGTPDQVEAFVERFSVDPTFPPFAKWAGGAGHELVVLSDGMDFYVKRILDRAGLSGLLFDANRLVITDIGCFEVEFPFQGQGCGREAMCKGAAIVRHRSNGQRVVYVGDGLSDRCALPEADLVFARGVLADICSDEGYDFSPFSHFDDVRSGIESFSEKLRS
jgi:2-hydroxy-3-keto-5-methylthiopentenyl-1-phosphate phosphatase